MVRVLAKYQRPLNPLSQTTTEAEASQATAVEIPLTTAESAEPALPDRAKKPRPGILERQQRHRAARLARFEEVRALYAQGATVSALAQKTGLDRKTVRNFSGADTFPERQASRQRPTRLDPYKPDVQQRWLEGCRTGANL